MIRLSLSLHNTRKLCVTMMFIIENISLCFQIFRSIDSGSAKGFPKTVQEAEKQVNGPNELSSTLCSSIVSNANDTSTVRARPVSCSKLTMVRGGSNVFWRKKSCVQLWNGTLSDFFFLGWKVCVSCLLYIGFLY